MRKFLPYIFILIIIIGVLSPITNVGAQTAAVTTAEVLFNPDCGILLGDVTNCIGSLFARVAWLLMTIMSFVLWLAGAILDYVIQETVLTMKEGVDKMSGINIAWKVVRDLMNIAFIFLLVYEGIKMIIGLSDLTKIKKFVSMIVLASLLVNFSLFFTKIMIDASNIVTIGVYNSVIDNAKTTTPGQKKEFGGLSVPFMHRLGLTSFFSQDSFNTTSNKVGGGVNMLIFFGMGTIVFLIASFVFLAIACLFVVRYVTLIVLLMLSPIAYMGMALPQIKPYADDWWKALNSQLLFAPIYMIMTSVILTLMSSPGFLNSNRGATTTTAVESTRSWGEILLPASATSSDASSMSLLLNFFIVISLTIASLVIAKKTSTQGSTFIANATGKLTATAGGAVMGGAAMASRRTIGAAASRLAENQNFQNWAGKSAIGERALKMTRKTASGSLDLRASSIGQQVASQTGVDFGKAQQGGFDKTLADKTATKEKFGQTLRDDAAKEAYAARISSGRLTRGGSSSTANTVFGVMGRSNRVVASKVLNNQLTPLQTQEQNLQNRESQLSQQLANLTNEEATLNAIPVGTRTPAQIARLALLGGAITTRGSIANITDQLTTTQTHLANATAEVTRIRALITANGLTNTTPSGTVTNPVTGATRQRRADEQNY